MTTTANPAPGNPVQFRVRQAGPNPRRAATPAPADEIGLTIDYVAKPRGARFGLTRKRFRPYRDAVDDAISSGQVYWVDWDYSTTPTVPPRPHDTTLDRLLEAIQNRQIVPDDQNAAAS